MSIYAYIAVMAAVTYLVRVLPMTLFRRPIKSRFLRSFLHYVPYACLTAMTFPAIFSATSSVLGGLAALTVGGLLAFQDKPLIVVALGASAAAFLAEILLPLMG